MDWMERNTLGGNTVAVLGFCFYPIFFFFFFWLSILFYLLFLSVMGGHSTEDMDIHLWVLALVMPFNSLAGAG
jgi:hypothetical protein